MKTCQTCQNWTSKTQVCSYIMTQPFGKQVARDDAEVQTDGTIAFLKTGAQWSCKAWSTKDGN
jgi:hypothetical protein